MPDHRSRRRHSIFAVSSALLLMLVAACPAFADTVRGRVVDPDNRPVPGATVLVVSGARVVTSIKTDGDGQFGPIVLAAGDYQLLVSAPGLRTDPQPIAVRDSAPLEVEIKLKLSAFSDSVVVSAAQVETPLSRTTDSVTVIDRSTLERRQTETVADALRFVPGMDVASSGGRGALTSLFPRGGNSDYTLVLVDGVEQNAFGGGYDAAHLATGEVERVEVVRGPESALYGDGAIGAIVQVVTRHGGPPTAQAFFEGGGYGTEDGNASTAGTHDAWSWGGALNWLTTNGDTRVWPSIGGPVSNDDYKRVDGSGSLSWSDRPDRRFRLNLRGGRNELGVPGPYGSDPAGLYSGLDTISRDRNYTGEVGGAATFATGDLHHDVQGTYANLLSKFASPFGSSEDQTRRATGRYQLDLEPHGVGVSAGVEFVHERADNTFIEGEVPGVPIPITRSDVGFFAEARPVLSDKVIVNLGLRVERIQRNALEGNPDPFGPRPPFDDDVVWSTNPKIAVAWFVRPEPTTTSTGFGATKLRAHAGTGIKPPTAFEIAFTDNPNLKPERNRSVDVGVDQAFLGSAILVDATYFDNAYTDLIVTVGTELSGASRYRTDNIANAAAHGLETGLSWHAKYGISVRGSFTFLHTEIQGVDNLPSLAPTPYQVGQPLVRRPPRQGSVEVAWTSPRGSLFAIVNGRSEMSDLEPNFASSIYPNPGYAILNFGGSLRLGRALEITGRVLNALDKQYEEVLGYPALGRSAMVGLRVATGR